MYTYRKLVPNEVLIDVRINDIMRLYVTGKAGEWGVFGPDGKIVQAPNPISGKPSYEIYGRKETARLQCKWLNNNTREAQR